MSNVKIVYYKRTALSSFHIHASEYTKCFYVPSEQTIIYVAQRGSFGGDDVSFSTEKRLLDEAEEIVAGRVPQVESVEFSDTKELEIDQYMITSLLDDARAKKALEDRVRQGVAILKGLVGG